MDDTEEVEKSELLVTMAEVYGKVFSEQAIAFMLRALAGIPFEDLDVAANAAMATCQYMPTCAELIALAELHGDPYRSRSTVIKATPAEAEALRQKYLAEENAFFEEQAEQRKGRDENTEV